MDKEIELTESETTINFGMRIVAMDKSRGLYLSDAGTTVAVTQARKFTSVTQAKEVCAAAGITNYRIIAHLPGAVSSHSVILAETGTTTSSAPTGKPRFD